jgi:hypothetical protein
MAKGTKKKGTRKNIWKELDGSIFESKKKKGQMFDDKLRF